ncbi:hypothetical protein [Shewanella algae]|uniref:hypothetical protein n=1 Tax=Shewanella algae TaxID=38313 RepID=UPI00399B2EBC
MSQELYNLTTVIIYSASAIIALLMLGAAISQISKLTSQVSAAVKSNSISELNALLSLEQQITERRIRLSQSGIAVKECKDKESEQFDSLVLQFNESKQMYLNGLDRLCFCVLKGLLQDDDMRLEYRDIIKSAITDFPEDFSTGTAYRNINKVYDRWADK